MNWYDSLPAADATVPCGSGTHAVRWEAGQLMLPSHPDAEAELVLGALGGDKPACVKMAETWTRHTADLAVLTAGPRCAADEVSVGWDEVAQQRANLPPLSQAMPAARLTARSGPGARRLRAVQGAPAVPAALGTPATLAIDPGMAETVRRQQQRIEMIELLALGSALQFRLSGAVCAAWAGPDKAGERAARRPAFAAALTGRFAPAAAEWLGIDPDAITVVPHEALSWGAMELTGTGAGRRLRAALPVGWLADVWACGMAVAGGHLVVAVDEPGYPLARVRALPAPGAEPVAVTVRAERDDRGGLPVWEVASD
jgi:hypothetical protein